MSDEYDSVRKKVYSLFSELAGDRTAQLKEPQAKQIRGVFARALKEEYSTSTAKEIAFHLVDWSTDAAFLIAVHLFPERFTPEELSAGVGLLLVHAPNHLAAAAKLAGVPIQDVFELGVCEDPEDNP